MKAVVIEEFGAPEEARLMDTPRPAPKPGEIVIEVSLAPVNFVDDLVFRGTYQFLPERPFTPGKGPVGTVCSVGANVEGFRNGDRVIAMAEHGGYAQFAAVPARDTYRLPDSVSFETAAAMSLAYDTAWVALFERGRMKPGDTVLVLGATGAVGDAAIQLAKARGARVLAAVSSEKRIAKVLASGADATVDLSRPDLRESLREQVWNQTDSRGADVVIDMLGGDVFDAALRAVAWRGRVVVVGFATGRIPQVKVNYLMLKNIEVSGVQVSDYRKRCPELMRQCFDEILTLAAEGRVSPGKVQQYPLADFARALGDVAQRRATARVVLSP
ncbi:MAG: NADPH2:quinone reductase [Rhodobacteraceae bacterium HLUCCA12]|nr:MAG: NADPH2:quinone reductase [Rhodobacteraceae bacterium HLUCCA12]